VDSIQAFRLAVVPKQDAALGDLKLYYCGSQVCPPGHRWGPGLKDHFKVHFIHNGKGVFRNGAAEFALGPGYGFFIAPGRLCSYQADLTEPWHYSWIAFQGTQAEEALQSAGITLDHPIFPFHPEPIAKSFRQLSESIMPSPSRELKLVGCLAQLLASLVDNADRAATAAAVPKLRDLYVKGAIDYLNTRYSCSVSMEGLANHVGLERKYLSRIFRMELGCSPRDYLLRLRMEKATSLLIQTDLGVTDIARSVGYDDPLLFSRMFRRVEGQSPTTFRKVARS
jgi:AraC-like DNA-binding protein